MSVMELSPVAAVTMDRRRRNRVRVKNLLRVTIGRGAGMVQDISTGGIRLRHTGMLSRGARVRLSFNWRTARFAGTAEVLASRVVSLGKGEQNGTVYETRFRFVTVSRDAHALLVALMAAESGSDSQHPESMIQ